MTPLERAARAVADVWWDSHHFGNAVPRYNWDRLHPAQRKASFATARAVLMAVREPDKAISKVGSAVDIELEWLESERAIPQVFTAMIDAILNDEESGA